MKPVKSTLRHACVALLCGGFVTGIASAAIPETEARSVTVQYSDLDLTRPEGAQALYRRIEAAAREVCGHADIRELRSFREARRCREQAVDEAVRQVNVGALTALHQKRTTRPASG